MKKSFLIFTFFCSVVFTLSAQSSLSKGRSQLNAGVGFTGWGIPIYVGFDYGVYQDVTVGGEISYRSYKSFWKDKYYNHSIFAITGNGNYHFNNVLNLPKQWDVYAGLNLGFYLWTYPSDFEGDHTFPLGFGAQVGARYFIADNFALNIEAGGGNASGGAQFGVTYKF